MIFAFSVQVQAQKSYFFVVCKTNGDSVSKFAGEYEKLVASAIEKEYPCAVSYTHLCSN